MHTIRTFLSPALVCVLSVAALSGCKTETYETGEATGKSIQSAANGIDRGITTLDATMNSLNDLVHHPAPDLAPQFAAFSKNLKQLDSQAEDVRRESGSMESKGKSYFTQWDAQIASITNEDLKARSMERRQEVDARFKQIKADYALARDKFKPLLGNLKDVRSVLSSDLTSSGVATVKPTVETLTKEAADVKTALTDLSAEFRKLGVEIGKVTPPPPPPATTTPATPPPTPPK
jgi:hypothetical protein